ncbi:hypothetical protein ACFQ0K_14935 [Nocardioides caeni]|uniref:Uncharacterized protein n=1 Tax=Nocardioides caeni TaxID=574700 RepID=A0A4S8NHQ5_9ACTN|nr:hypothetical protein [Nocardioides caeni]THV14659.1 hypothetical protein E9934_08345 [Nocardioides caeni]
MSNDQPTADPNDDTGQSLSPQPEPTAVPQAPPPGGPNAVPGVGGDGAYSVESRDPVPQHNPATDELPEETTEPEDTDTAATRGEETPDPEDESPA